MKNKALGFYLAIVSGLLTIALLIMTLIYSSRNGIVGGITIGALVVAILCQVSLMFGERFWTDFTGIIAPVLLAYVLMRVITDGIWNIAEAINGIQMIGLPELASMNIQMAVLNFIAIVVSVVSCFAQKSKSVG